MTLSLSPRARLWLSSFISLALFAAASWVVWRELDMVDGATLREAFHDLPTSHLLFALLLTGLNYAVLTGYDHLAFRYIGKRLSFWRVTLAAFTGYALANSIGLALVAGASARYRFYCRWGITHGELSRIIVFYSVTCWLGIATLGGWTLLFHPLGSGNGTLTGIAAQECGLLLLLAIAAYLRLCATAGAPIDLGVTEVKLPTGRVAASQVLLSLTDWCLAAGIVYALLPADALPYGTVLAAFVGAQVAGMASHVPGGLGVFEGAMFLLLRGQIPDAPLLSALLLFRVLYYFVPLAPALALLLADEVRQRRQAVPNDSLSLSTDDNLTKN